MADNKFQVSSILELDDDFIGNSLKESAIETFATDATDSIVPVNNLNFDKFAGSEKKLAKEMAKILFNNLKDDLTD